MCSNVMCWFSTLARPEKLQFAARNTRGSPKANCNHVVEAKPRKAFSAFGMTQSQVAQRRRPKGPLSFWDASATSLCQIQLLEGSSSSLGNGAICTFLLYRPVGSKKDTSRCNVVIKHQARGGKLCVMRDIKQEDDTYPKR